jgi:predicted PurR-regulated permease PerM
VPPSPRLGRPTRAERGRLAAAGATAWQAVGIAAAFVAAWWLGRALLPVLLPAAVALLLSALVRPLARALETRGVPGALAAAAAVAVLVLGAALAIGLIVPPFVARIAALGENLETGVREVAYSVAHDVAGVSRDQSDRTVDGLIASLDSHRGRLVGDLLSGASMLATALGAGVLILFLTFFTVRDGPRMWSWVVAFAPRERRPRVHRLGARAWDALTVYIRGVCFVATVDATFIGLALVLVGVPLALPLIVLTWVAAFFPIIGALAAGVAAVLVALVAKGVGGAVIIAASVIAVQQLEGNVLYPIVVGPRMRLHPAAVLLAVTFGGTVAGVAGAFLGVPVATVCAAALDEHAAAGEPPTVALPTPAQRAGEAPARPGSGLSGASRRGGSRPRA